MIAGKGGGVRGIGGVSSPSSVAYIETLSDTDASAYQDTRKAPTMMTVLIPHPRLTPRGATLAAGPRACLAR